MTIDEAALVARMRALFDIADGAHDFTDDAAILPPVAAGAARIVTTDAVVEGRDFDEALYPLAFAGRRAIAQNVSDVSSMGAAPVGFVWSLAIPRRWLDDDARRLDAFLRGAASAARATGLLLYGGDLSSTDGPLVASITAFGDVDGAPLSRGGARPGDGIWIERALGASSAGLRALLRDRPGDRFDAWRAALDDDVRACVDAHLDPPSSTALARALVGRATACMDVSDGLALDLARLCAASGVAAALDVVPLAAGAVRDDGLFGGEDFALLWTSPVDVGGLRIGTIVAGQGVVVDGTPLPPRGFDHFGNLPETSDAP